MADLHVSEMVVARLRAAGCVFAEDEAALLLAAATPAAGGRLDLDRLDALVGRRVAGEPLEQILGWAEFAGLRIAVDPGVFVPRRRTEFLVRLALSAIDAATGSSTDTTTGSMTGSSTGSTTDPTTGSSIESSAASSTGTAISASTATVIAPGAAGPIVVDLCCGSGAVGAAVLAARPTVALYAADVEPAAVDCARRNLAAARAVLLGDLFTPLPAELRGHVQVVTANAPYVPSHAVRLMPPEARDHEPKTALDGGPDGLDLHRRITAGVLDWLAPGGVLLVETSERQAPVAVELLAAAGLRPEVHHDEDLDACAVLGRVS